MKLSSFGTWSCIARLSRRHARICGDSVSGAAPQHTLYFLPLPQGQLSLRPTFMREILTLFCQLTISRRNLSRGATRGKAANKSLHGSRGPEAGVRGIPRDTPHPSLLPL